MAIDPTQRGYAMSAVASAIEVLTGNPVRLHWCVDLDAHKLTYNQHDPTNTNPAQEWGKILERFRTALDAQTFDAEHDGKYDTRAEVALTLWTSLKSDLAHMNGKRVVVDFYIPWSGNLTQIAGRPTPIGVWRLQPTKPKVRSGPNKVAGPEREGDAVPMASEWWDGSVPF